VSDEFYIGYEPEMPPRLAQRVRRIACGLVALALLIPGVLVFTEDRFADGVFEFGRVRTFNGQIVEFPYPALITADADGAARAYWMVGRGKHGAADLVRGRDGQSVSVAGSLIQRDGDMMIEVAPGAIRITATASSHAIGPLRSRGIVVLDGEIVDSKCHLGVMKPGEGPTHRDCAVRCLLGRIPPMFVSDGPGGPGRVSLVTEAGGPLLNADVWAGRRLSIRGEILQRGAQRFLAVARAEIRVLNR
jgi:hypothetical protein